MVGLGFYYPKCSCNHEHEVCEHTFYSYNCECDTGYYRANDGECLNIDECHHEHLNNTDIYKCNKKNTLECNDYDGGYNCICRDQFSAIDFCNSCTEGSLERELNATHSECISKRLYCTSGICNMGHSKSCSTTHDTLECKCNEDGDYDYDCSKYRF